MSTSLNSTNTSRPQPKPQAAPQMQAVIELICKNHGVDIYREHAGMKLENGPYMPLVIEHLTSTKRQDGTTVGRISVAHYYYQEGDACADPDIVFYFERSADGKVTKWMPFEITQVAFGHYFECYQWVARGATPDPHAINRQADIAELAEHWAQNLHDQSFTATLDKYRQLKVEWKNEGERGAEEAEEQIF